MTLTQAAQLTKRTLLSLIILSILGISGLIGYQIWYQNYLKSQPPEEPYAEERFGQLPKLNIKAKVASISNYTYSLDTTTGGLPSDLPKVLRVYFVPQTGISLLAPKKAQELAKKLGFNLGVEIISQTVYKYTNETGSYVTIDLNTNNFKIQRVTKVVNGLESTPSAKTITPEHQVRIVGDFKNFLASKGLLADELNKGVNKIIDNEINLFPADFEGLKIVTPTLSRSLVRATIKEVTSEEKYSSINYTYWTIDKTESSSYKLKKIEDAFNELKSGRGFIIIESSKPQVSISNIYLAYYQDEQYAPYLQPVYVFEGPNFAAYIPAIASQGQAF